MKIFLSSTSFFRRLQREKKEKTKFTLLTFFEYNKKDNYFKEIIENAEEILIDSGAHSFQSGKTGNYDEYIEKYIDFIKNTKHHKNIVGYFELDVDHEIGYEKVLYYRKKLEEYSDKIIPVWHKNRGIKDYVEMCREYSGKTIAIAGFKNQDIKDEQFELFINVAHQNNCKIHGLGFTRLSQLPYLNFDSVDSSTFIQSCAYGDVNNLVFDEYPKLKKIKNKKMKTASELEKKIKPFELQYFSYQQWVQIQKFYIQKFKK